MQSFSYHSRKQDINEDAVSGLLRDHPGIKKLQKMVKDGESQEKIERVLHDVYSDMHKDLQKRERMIEQIVKKHIPKKGVSNKPKILTALKPVSSIISKVFKRGKGITRVGDIVRGAVLFDDKEQVENFIKDLRRKESNIIMDYEHKGRGGDSTYGYYGSYHFDLNLNGLVSELQVMTKKLWQYKKSAHKIYNDVRDSGGKPSAGDQHLSKMLFDLGNRGKRLREGESETLEQMFERVLEENTIVREIELSE